VAELRGIIVGDVAFQARMPLLTILPVPGAGNTATTG